MSKKTRDIKKAIKREKTFSTEAKSEGKGAAKRAKEECKAGLVESCKDSKWEQKVDDKFAQIRANKVRYLKSKLKSK